MEEKKNYILLSYILIIKEKQKIFQLSWYELIATNSGVILHLHKVEDWKSLKIKELLWEEEIFFIGSHGNCSHAINLLLPC